MSKEGCSKTETIKTNLTVLPDFKKVLWITLKGGSKKVTTIVVLVEFFWGFMNILQAQFC